MQDFRYVGLDISLKQRALGDIHFCFLSQLAYNSEILSKFVVNAYVSIKYEVETIDNDAIINMVYQIFDTGVTINFIWFAINTIIILGLYIKLRRK